MFRKIIFTYILFILVAFPAYNQEKFKPEWTIGMGGGIVLPAVDFASGNRKAFETKSEMHSHGGISIRYISEKNLGFIVELNYSQLGWTERFNAEETLTEKYDRAKFAYSRNLNYMEMPILTHIYFGRKVRFVVNLGPKISYLINEKETISDELVNYLASGETSPRMSTHQYFRKTDKSIDYGLMGGIGSEFRTKAGAFALEGRYYFGLSDVYNNKKSDYFERSANRVISVKLTYYMKLFNK